MDVTLTDVEVRVLGCLIEKAVTTPEYYPLTLNSLTTACNQKSNRDPVMALDDKTVVRAIDALRYDYHIVWQVTLSGSRVPKYKHDILKKWDFTFPELAVLCVIMLRGPQTLGELRGRTGRLHKFEGLSEIQDVLDKLVEKDGGPFVIKLPREPGRKESRYMHLLCGEIEVSDEEYVAPQERARLEVKADDDRFARLEGDVASLKELVDGLKLEFQEFKKQFE